MKTVALQRKLLYMLEQLGSVGSLGLGLALAAVLGWFTLIQAGEKEMLASRLKLDAFKQQVLANSSLPESSSLSHEEQLNVFYQSFPTADKMPDALKRVYHASDKLELLLETGEYSWIHTGSERLARYRIALPIKGSFKQILGFMDTALQDNPALALENAVFKRDKVDDAIVEAKLTFMVFVDTRP